MEYSFLNVDIMIKGLQIKANLITHHDKLTLY